MTGQLREAKVIYLALTSRFFSPPVAVAVKGVSSSGKSHLVEQVLKFFPESSYHWLSGMSPKYLAHLEQDSLKNRFLVLAEWAGLNNESGETMLRILLSEGRLVNGSAVQGADNVYRSEKTVLDGPTGLLLTTTKTSVHAENETRMLSLTVDPSADQTRAVLRSIAAGAHRSLDLAEWIALQVRLDDCPHEVSIPFSAALADLVDANVTRMRRDFTKLLHLISAHALLHHESRSLDEHGRIVAELVDYGVVRELVKDLFAEGASASVAAEVRETVNAVARLGRNRYLGVSERELVQELALDKSTVSRRVQRALDLGLIENDSYSRRAKSLRVGLPLPDDREVLPTVQEVADYMSTHPSDRAEGSVA